MFKLRFYIYFSISVLGFINCLDLCGEWDQFNSIKCFKVIEVKATEEDALEKCSHLEKSSALISIHSKDEQEFLNNLLVKYNNISNNVWIGMKYTDKSYKWSDGTINNFTNWAEDAIRDGTEPCVQMSLVKSTLGKWNDEACKKTALVVCQKKPVLNMNLLRESIDKMEKTMNSMIPIGFIYTQLPEQSAPEHLWPNMNWEEITEQYSGLFFRAEGNGSEPFGLVQKSNQSEISIISSDGYRQQLANWQYISPPKYNLVNNSMWTNLTTVSEHGVHSISVYKTSGDVRPRNTAIKIWKRIQMILK